MNLIAPDFDQLVKATYCSNSRVSFVVLLQSTDNSLQRNRGSNFKARHNYINRYQHPKSRRAAVGDAPLLFQFSSFGVVPSIGDRVVGN
jgi:hypothetical protein